MYNNKILHKFSTQKFNTNVPHGDRDLPEMTYFWPVHGIKSSRQLQMQTVQLFTCWSNAQQAGLLTEFTFIHSCQQELLAYFPDFPIFCKFLIDFPCLIPFITLNSISRHVVSQPINGRILHKQKHCNGRKKDYHHEHIIAPRSLFALLNEALLGKPCLFN